MYVLFIELIHENHYDGQLSQHLQWQLSSWYQVILQISQKGHIVYHNALFQARHTQSMIAYFVLSEYFGNSGRKMKWGKAVDILAMSSLSIRIERLSCRNKFYNEFKGLEYLSIKNFQYPTPTWETSLNQISVQFCQNFGASWPMCCQKVQNTTLCRNSHVWSNM